MGSHRSYQIGAGSGLLGFRGVTRGKGLEL